MQSDELEHVVSAALNDFYRRRLQKLCDLKLKETLRKKNPYLYRAIGINNATEIVKSLLQAYMSSSEETIFGDAFFEPVVKAVCKGVSSDGSGVDVILETDDAYSVISVKSGPCWGNSSQMKKLKDDFSEARHRFYNRKAKKQFKALLGHCYGRKNNEPTSKNPYTVRSGQAFWQEITGDPEFYIKLIRWMDKRPEDHRAQYEDEWDKAINRFAKEFLIDFSTEDGSVDWEKLLKFNSGSSDKTNGI